MPMGIFATVVGAITTAVGLAGAVSESSPGAISPRAWGVPITAAERALARMQLDVASSLRSQIQDPAIVEAIYANLPEQSMDEEARNRFTQEYAEIKQGVNSMAMQLANDAMGQNLDDMVARGVMTGDQAARQRIESEAAMAAITKIWNKRLDASRSGLARQAFMTEQQSGLGIAGAIGNMDMNNRRLYQGAVTSYLDSVSRRSELMSGLRETVDRANAQVRIDVEGAHQEAWLRTGSGLLDMGQSLLGGRQEEE